MSTGIDLAADGTSMLPRRGTAELRKIARLETQREHLDLVTEDTLWKKKENRKKTIPDYVNGGEEKEKKVKRTSREKWEDVQGKEEERERDDHGVGYQRGIRGGGRQAIGGGE